MFERMIKNTIEIQRDEDFKRAQYAIIVDVIIIVTWVIAVLSYALDVEGLKYVLCACIMFLSFVILLLEVILNEDATQRWRKALHHCCSNNYRVRTESSTDEANEKVKLRSKDSFHFQDTLDRNKRGKCHLNFFFQLKHFYKNIERLSPTFLVSLQHFNSF